MTRGGGANGHLAIIMYPAAYLACATVAFVPPVHPGDAPVHLALSTGNQITETNRQYTANIKAFDLYHLDGEKLKAQILEAPKHCYLKEL